MQIRKFFRSNWPIIIILIFAAILRFWRLEALTTFGGDQGYDFLIVKRMLVDGKFTLLGPKIGPYNQLGNLYLGPAYYYLIAPFLLIFNFDPIGPAVFTVILALATILIIYLIGIKFFSKPVAILASSLYAFNVYLIDQSRASSNPHLIPFFVSLLILSILKITIAKSQSKIWPIITGISLGTLFQLHYLTISLIPVVLVMLIISRRLGTLVLMISSFLVAILPQITFEFRHQFFITSQFFKQFSQGNNVSSIDRFLDHFSRSTQNLSQVFINTDKFLFAATALLILILLFTTKSKKARKSILLLILTVILGLIFASIYSGEISLHYFASIYVSIVLLMSIILMALLEFAKNPLIKSVLILLIFQIFASNFLGLNLSNPEGYTMPKGWNLKGVKKASAIIATDAGPSKFNIAATLDGDTRARPYRYLVEIAGKIPEDVEHYPTSDVLYLIARDEDDVIKRYTVWEVASFVPFQIAQKWEIQNGIKLYKLVKTHQQNI